MKQYMYRAEWLCELCAQHEAMALGIELGKFDGDSDDGPVGPYEEPFNDLAADYPCHCAGCDVFLKNELTDDGIAYVREQIANITYPSLTSSIEDIPEACERDAIINEWRTYYNL